MKKFFIVFLIIVVFIVVFTFLPNIKAMIPNVISICSVDIYMRNIILILLLLFVLFLWDKVLKEKKLISRIPISDDYREYLDASNDVLESSFNKFVKRFVWSTIVIIILSQINGSKIEYIGLVVILLVNISIFGFSASQLYDGVIKTIKKDKYFWLNVWNALCFSKEIKKGLENKKYLKVWEVSIENRTSITIKDITSVRNSLSKLSDPEIEELLYMLYVPEYLPEFIEATRTISLLIVNFLTSIYIGNTISELIKKFVQNISAISDISQTMGIENVFILITNLLIGFIVLYIIVIGTNYFTCKQKRNQVKVIIGKLLNDECRKRGLKFNMDDLNKANHNKFLKSLNSILNINK